MFLSSVDLKKQQLSLLYKNKFQEYHRSVKVLEYNLYFIIGIHIVLLTLKAPITTVTAADDKFLRHLSLLSKKWI